MYTAQGDTMSSSVTLQFTHTVDGKRMMILWQNVYKVIPDLCHCNSTFLCHSRHSVGLNRWTLKGLIALCAIVVLLSLLYCCITVMSVWMKYVFNRVIKIRQLLTCTTVPQLLCPLWKSAACRPILKISVCLFASLSKRCCTIGGGKLQAHCNITPFITTSEELRSFTRMTRWEYQNLPWNSKPKPIFNCTTDRRGAKKTQCRMSLELTKLTCKRFEFVLCSQALNYIWLQRRAFYHKCCHTTILNDVTAQL